MEIDKKNKFLDHPKARIILSILSILVIVASLISIIRVGDIFPGVIFILLGLIYLWTEYQGYQNRKK